MAEKLKVFVSSVIRQDELNEERTVACQKNKRARFEPICFEPPLAESIPTTEWMLRNIQNCHIFVQLLDKTLTAAVLDEYEIAKNENKPRLIFLKKNQNRNPELDDHIKRVKRDLVHAEFSDARDLKSKLLEAVDNAIVDLVEGRASQTADACIERAEAFCIERLDALYDKTPTLLNGNYPKVVLHIVPCSAFDKRSALINLELLETDERFRALGASAWRRPIYEENSITVLQLCPNLITTDASLEIFDTGIVEAAKLLSYDPNDKRIVRTYEHEVTRQLPQYISLLQQHDLRPPLYVKLSFKEIKDWRMAVTPVEAPFDVFHPKPPIAKNKIAKGKFLYSFDEVKTPEKAAHFMKPMFDVIWRAAHWPKSFR